MDGEKADLWLRQPLGLHRNGGESGIVHEHASVPFYTGGSRKAAVDLKPPWKREPDGSILNSPLPVWTPPRL